MSHPLAWAASPPPEYDEFFVTFIHFWAEIPEEIITSEVKRVFGEALDFTPASEGGAL
jgi:hypothetical protein